MTAIPSMSVDPPPGDDPGDVLADPRVEPDHLRSVRAPSGHPILLVGCVHDHPASIARVRRLVATLEPDAVAVELPGLALPLFERSGRASAADEARTPVPGGEMSAALDAGERVGARRVGVDALDGGFVASLLGELRRASASAGTLRRIGGSVASVARHAVSCRLAAALGSRSPGDPLAERAFDHGVDQSASPNAQAADERRALTRSLSVLRAIERPVADEVVDAARERTIAANVAALAASDDVVCVLGFDHLDGIAELLAARCGRAREPDSATLRRHWD